MNLWLLLLTVPPAVYAAVLLRFRAGLNRQEIPSSEEQPAVSVVVAARNEESRLPGLLRDLRNQIYPPDRIEFLIADDHSTDGTAALVTDFAETDPRFRLIPVTSCEPGLTAKKNALTQAVHQARGEIVLCTDADCRVTPRWAESMVSWFTPDTGIVAGYSELCGTGSQCGLFAQMQAVDFLMLMSAARGSANLGRAWAASGQNFAYRKVVFDEVGGYARIGHRISGDDVLFLQWVRKTTRWKVRFAASGPAAARTAAEPSLSAFIHQRTRWASNGIYQWILNKVFFGYVLNTYLTNLILFLSAPLCILAPETAAFLAAGWLLKATAETGLFIKGSGLNHRRDLFPAFFPWFFAQVPYVVFVGIRGTLGSFTWKDRQHSAREQT